MASFHGRLLQTNRVVRAAMNYRRSGILSPDEMAFCLGFPAIAEWMAVSSPQSPPVASFIPFRALNLKGNRALSGKEIKDFMADSGFYCIVWGVETVLDCIAQGIIGRET